MRNSVRIHAAMMVMAAVAGAGANSARAAIISMVDQNSVAQIDTDSQAGMFNWFINGTDVLAQQWFWFRVGNTPEQSINAISASTITTPTARDVTTSYNNGAYKVEVAYHLTGGSPGAGTSDIAETIRITNFTDSPLDFHFFQYSDFDLSSNGTDTVTLGKNLSGLYNEALQTGGNISLTETADTVTTPGANHGEANLFPVTLNKLNDGLPTTLNDNAGPVGPGDATWALQWDLSIASGGTAIISKDKLINISTATPEPTTLAVMATGAVVLAARKRRGR